MTSATEEYALRTKTPFIGAEGQFEGYEAQWAQANRRSFAYLQYKPKPWAVSLRLLLRASLWPMCRSAPSRWPCTHRTTSRRRRACLMLPWAREVRQRRAFRSASKSAKVASPISTTRTTSIVPCCKPGRCLLDMIPQAFDTERVAHHGRGRNHHIGADQQAPRTAGNGRKTGKIKTTINDMSVGQYDCTVSAGPSFSTLRQRGVRGYGFVWTKLAETDGYCRRQGCARDGLAWRRRDRRAHRQNHPA